MYKNSKELEERQAYLEIKEEYLRETNAEGSVE